MDFAQIDESSRALDGFSEVLPLLTRFRLSTVLPAVAVPTFASCVFSAPDSEDRKQAGCEESVLVEKTFPLDDGAPLTHFYSPAQLEDFEPLCCRQLVLWLASDQLPLVSGELVTALQKLEAPLAAGTLPFLHPALTHVHLFDPDDGPGDVALAEVLERLGAVKELHVSLASLRDRDSWPHLVLDFARRPDTNLESVWVELDESESVDEQLRTLLPSLTETEFPPCVRVQTKVADVIVEAETRVWLEEELGATAGEELPVDAHTPVLVLFGDSPRHKLVFERPTQ